MGAKAKIPKKLVPQALEVNELSLIRNKAKGLRIKVKKEGVMTGVPKKILTSSNNPI